MKKPLTLDGRLFGLKVPRHANLGCLSMLVGIIFAFLLSALGARLLIHADLNQENPYYFVAVLVSTSFLVGIIVAAICRERRGLYALLTALFYPVLLPPPMLLGYYLIGILDGAYIHSFLIGAIICPVAAYLGATAWEKLFIR